MEHNYPLKSYHVNDGSFERYPSDSPQYTYTSATFSPPSHIIGSFQQGRHSGYQHLGDANVGHEPRPKAKLVWGSFLYSWLIEILASCIAAGSLIAIIVILHKYNGHNLSDTHIGASLTLNGVVAALSTLARVALMVPVASALSQESWIWFSDNARPDHQCHSRLKDLELSNSASRGALGSAIFLLTARRRYIAYIGAIVTIISLAFGTFVQQVLTIGEYDVPHDNSALSPGNLPRAESWQYYNGVPSEFQLTPPFSVRAATYSGVLSDNPGTLTVNCPTGNCTWPITPSLAVCGECSSTTYVQQCTESQCNYTLPSGSAYLLSNTRSGGVGFVVGSNSGGAKYNFADGDKLYLVNFDVLGATYNSLAQGFDNSDTAASECALWMCIQSYSAHMINGVLYEQVAMESSDLVKPTTETGGTFTNYTFADLPAAMNPVSDVSYNASVIAMSGFGWLHKIFNGSAYLNIESSQAGTDSVDAIWNASSNLDPWIKKVAASMTNAIRYDDPSPQPPSRRITVPAPQRPEYDGTSHRLGIQVRWAWLVLPALSVLLSLVFLILIMIETARSRTATWKGSMLPVLFIDVDQDLKHRATGVMNQWRGLFRAVGDQRVALKEDVGGRLSIKVA